MMDIRLAPDAYMPIRAHDQDAGLDLKAPKGYIVYPNGERKIHRCSYIAAQRYRGLYKRQVKPVPKRYNHRRYNRRRLHRGDTGDALEHERQARCHKTWRQDCPAGDT